MDESSNKNRKLALKLLIAPVLMFGFGFAMVPLYDVFCRVTGLNGKTGNQVFVEEGDRKVIADDQRVVTVQFLAMNNESAPIRFKPKQTSLKVHPGEIHEIYYTATNLTQHELVSQSVPSVSPLEAARHIKKVECFCFENQTIAVGETKQMPLRFYVDKELPSNITKLSLNYTIFDVTKPLEGMEELAQHEHTHEHTHEHSEVNTKQLN